MTPSKRPFGYPITETALEFFCDPQPGSEFAQPFYLDGYTYAVSAHLALRCSYGHFADHTNATDKQAEFVRALPWSLFEQGKRAWAPEYRSMDDSRGGIYRGEARPLWHRDGKGGFVLNRDEPLVGIGSGPVVPVAMLQLLGRLPRPEIMSETERVLYMRFNGGQVIVPSMWPEWRKPTPAFWILNTRKPGAFEF